MQSFSGQFDPNPESIRIPEYSCSVIFSRAGKHHEKVLFSHISEEEKNTEVGPSICFPCSRNSKRNGKREELTKHDGCHLNMGLQILEGFFCWAEEH